MLPAGCLHTGQGIQFQGQSLVTELIFRHVEQYPYQLGTKSDRGAFHFGFCRRTRNRSPLPRNLTQIVRRIFYRSGGEYVSLHVFILAQRENGSAFFRSANAGATLTSLLTVRVKR